MIERNAIGSIKSVYEVEDRITMQRYALKLSNKQAVKKFNLQSYLINEKTILE